MPNAEASQTRLAIIAESVIGTIPATPTWQTLRYVSEGLKYAKQTAVSDEIRGDGNVTDISDVGRSVSGPLAFELSYGTYDLMLESLFRGAWTTNVLKNGFTHKSVALEKTFEQGATDSFIRYRGVEVDTMDLQIESRQIIKGSFGLRGIASPAPTTSIITGATYAAASSTPVMNASAHVGALSMSGVTDQPKCKTVNLQVRSNLYENDAIGDKDIDSLGMGRFEVSGNLVAYFRSLDVYNAMQAHGDVGLTLGLGSISGSKYTLALPRMKLLDGTPLVEGRDRSVMIDVPFQAIYDGSSAATATLTRAVA